MENVLINMETGRLEPEEPVQQEENLAPAPAGPSQEPVEVLFLGGTQQTYSLNLESSNLSAAALKPKRLLQAKSAAEEEEQSWTEGRCVQPPTSILKTELEAKTQRESTSTHLSPKKRAPEYLERQPVEAQPI